MKQTQHISDLTEAPSKSNEHLQAVLDTMPVAMLLLDENATVRQLNDNLSKLFSKSQSDILNKLLGNGLGCLDASIHPDECGHADVCKTCPIYNSLIDVLSTGKGVKDVEFKQTFSGQQENFDLWLKLSAEPLVIDNKTCVIAALENITSRKIEEENKAKLLKKMEKINQELKDFAYIISHDLKAPLRGIRSIVKWISEDYIEKLDEKGKQQLQILSGRVERMKNLIDGVLQYSRVGRSEEDFVEIDLNELLPSVIDLIAPSENIKITIEGKLPTIVCEETKIRQVFQNLLDNAVKFMDKTHGQIKITCKEHNNYWQFSVADNGSGIEERDLDRVFGMFQTGKSRDKFESTGVGLTLIKKIIELYNGKIWIESKVGQGSTFYFTLPKLKQGIKNVEFQTSVVN